MADKLLPHGYSVFTIDIQWYELNATSYEYRAHPAPTMDDYGRLLPAANRFPSSTNGKGLRPIADQVHALGLKFGIHLMRGIPRAAVEKNLPIFGTTLHAEKSRLRRSLANPTALMRNIRHRSLRDRREKLNQLLRGHHAYNGLAGNVRSMLKLHRAVERYWHKMLCTRSWAASCTWAVFNQLKERFPLQRPKIYLSYGRFQTYAVL
jgi:hypothetical protein